MATPVTIITLSFISNICMHLDINKLLVKVVIFKSNQFFRILIMTNDIQCRTCLEPGDLLLIVAVVYENILPCSIRMMQTNSQGLTRCKLSQSQNIYAIVFLDLVVIVLIHKSQS